MRGLTHRSVRCADAWRWWLLLTFGLACAPAWPQADLSTSTPAVAEPRAVGGTLPGGAHWQAIVPAGWNGTLLVWSHGYTPDVAPVEVAPPDMRDALLGKGYALLASDYGAAGWALAEAVPAQRAAVDAFVALERRPSQVIAWGASMGGLVTTALAEQPEPVIDAALALCPSIGGTIGMMNTSLDGAFAFRTLVAPEAGLELSRVTDDRVNAKRVQAALEDAMRHPQGRARVALSAVLAAIPGWTRPDHMRPAATDVEAQLEEMAATFQWSAFPPRVDQEARAGGVYSWNTGIDYRRLLAASGRRGMVEALYRKAGLSLERDLARLNSAPRQSADPAAVAYMMDHYTPNARPKVPVLSLQAIGDGITPPALQSAYVAAAGARMAHGLWLNEAGHCRMSAGPVLAALTFLRQRVASGQWPGRPAGFVAHTPQPFFRACFRAPPRAGRCPSRPPAGAQENLGQTGVCVRGQSCR